MACDRDDESTKRQIMTNTDIPTKLAGAYIGLVNPTRTDTG
jgi:hypothetical protein